jgi:predicted porin
MMKKKNYTGLIALALTAVVMVVAAPAYAVDFTISGQVNRAALYADDGTSAKWFFVDNDNSSTRFRFRGSNDFEGGWKVGFLWEVEMQSNASNRVAMTDDSDTRDVTFKERHMDLWVEKWGTARLGQGDTASNGTSEVDLSGTAVAAYSDIEAVGGSFEFRDGDDKTGITVGSSRSNFDGLSRKDRVRYDTPRWAGFFASGSIEGNSEWDVAARYAGDFGWARFAAAAGWSDFGTSSDSKDGTRDGNFSSSASMLFDFGLNFTASYATRKQDDTNPWNLFGKIGYRFLKKHAASIQYSRTKNLLNKDDKGDSFGVGYVYTPWKSVEFYGTYYLHMLDLDQGSDPDDINIFMTGARVRF